MNTLQHHLQALGTHCMTSPGLDPNNYNGFVVIVGARCCFSFSVFFPPIYFVYLHLVISTQNSPVAESSLTPIVAS